MTVTASPGAARQSLIGPFYVEGAMPERYAGGASYPRATNRDTAYQTNLIANTRWNRAI